MTYNKQRSTFEKTAKLRCQVSSATAHLQDLHDVSLHLFGGALAEDAHTESSIAAIAAVLTAQLPQQDGQHLLHILAYLRQCTCIAMRLFAETQGHIIANKMTYSSCDCPPVSQNSLLALVGPKDYKCD